MLPAVPALLPFPGFRFFVSVGVVGKSEADEFVGAAEEFESVELAGVAEEAGSVEEVGVVEEIDSVEAAGDTEGPGAVGDVVVGFELMGLAR